MILKWFAVCISLICYCSTLRAQQVFKPFPQHIKYSPGTIKPGNLSQVQLDDQVRTFYVQWEKRFVKTVPGKPQSYIWFEGLGNKQCVSEGQGYGMIITVLIAGYNVSAKIEYDNMFHYCCAHPSKRSKYLMAWAQNVNGKDIDHTSATDGDLDIAYSLLLADKQWGSKGSINYLQEAKNRIAAIMQYEINHQTWSVLLSNAVEWDSKDYNAMRSSDFMPSHFKAFEQVTNDARWSEVIYANYKLFETLQENYSPEAALLPDFIININHRPKPAPPNFLESRYDGYYNYNACRVPWRIATDYLLTGDKRAKVIADKINQWIRATTSNNPYNLSAGYTLAGNDIKGRYFEALSFIAPFTVAAMVDKMNQQWLNQTNNYLAAFKLKGFDYYDNSIKLLDMLIISGNYWGYNPQMGKP
jgi:endo-1,4-beta-D-glucanase Y